MYYTFVDCPIGPFFLAGSGDSLSIASFSTGHQQRSPQPDWKRDPAALRFAVEQIEQYFAGERTRFDLPLDIVGTSFQKDVWQMLRTIPFGETWTYGQIATLLGKPGASRAVGAANGANVLPLIIPCHRVIGSDGTLTGFGGGMATKQWLLTFEGAGATRQGTLF